MSNNVRMLVAAAALVVLSGPGSVVAGAEQAPVFHRMTANAASAGPVLHLEVTGAFDTVHYSPQPGVWVVEMPMGELSAGVAELSRPDLGIERARLSHVEEFGKQLTRLTVWIEDASHLMLVPHGEGLDLRFEVDGPSGPDLRTQPPAPPAAATSAPAEPAERRAAVDPPEAAAAAEAPAVPSGSGPVSLLEVSPVQAGDGVVVRLRCDGPVEGRTFTLPEPARLVLDLPRVINRVDRNLFPVGTEAVRRVRVAQHQAVPEPITRIVIDLEQQVDHELVRTADGAELRLGAGSRAGAPPARIAPVTVARADADTSGGTRETAAAQPAAAGPATAVARPERTARVEAEPSEPIPAAMFESPREESEPAIQMERSPWVADRSQLIERAAAGQALRGPAGGADSFATTEVDTEEVQYTGDPITLTLKDADIKDVLRTFSTLTQLNIVVDPGVSGSVTVELRNVPWDQALDLILRINNLDYVLENNVLRVAPISKLAAEKQARAQYQVNEELAKPLKTVTKPLSYARAGEVAGLIQDYMSQRGSIVVDERTNTLIIRDTVDRVEGVLRLVETLDQPTPQVVIEARIVETTRQFSRSLGVTWGFSATMDPLHGNDTGLEFPNTVTATGDVSLLQGGNGLLSMSFGDILNTFNLDFVLGASEQSGLAKIVSTPRVQTQNLQQARIRSGIQIPVQTIANNTVTVQYVDATLNMEVTPQITAEGTVNLDVTVRKQRPTEAFAVQGGQNLPIFTREAETQLLIRDGGTTVIGGIYQLTDDSSTSRVPYLADVPVLGNLFKNKTRREEHDELLIFITPRIVKY